NDTILLGDGDDVAQWDPGDGNDTIDGQAGSDTLQFNGANLAETLELSANGDHARFTRTTGNVVLDLDGVEHVNVNPLGDADVITVNNMAGTDATDVTIDLAGAIGGLTGDGAADSVIVQGTNAADAVNIVGAGTSVQVLGLAATTTVNHTEAGDQLTVNTLGGDDVITAGTLPPGLISLTITPPPRND